MHWEYLNMKNMPDQFENEMKQRLQHYEEEPQKDLWNGIAPHIASAGAKSASWKWLLMLSVIMSLVPLLTSSINDEQNGEILRRESQESIIQGPANPLVLSMNNNKKVSVLIVTDFKVLKDQTSTIKAESTVDQVRTNSILVDNNSMVKQISAIMLKKNFHSVGVPASIVSTIHDNFFPQKGIEELTVNDLGATEVMGAEIVIPESADSVDTKEEVPNLTEEIKKEVSADIVHEKIKRGSVRKTSIYILAMPTFGYQRIESNQNDNIIIESIKRIPAFSTKRLGVRIEIGAEYKLTPRLKAFGGLLYFQRKQKIDYTEKQVDSLVIHGNDGEVTIEPVFKQMDKSIEYELKNIGIQVGLNYAIKQKVFLHQFGIGIELQKPVNKENGTAISQGFGQKPDYYVFNNLYYRLQYPSEGRLKAVLQPSLNYSLYINENLNAPFYVKPFGLGLHFGCTYNF
jgi:hypothetical protein